MLTKFISEYRADVLLRNSPDGRYGVKGRVVNKISLDWKGKVSLDFCGSFFQRREGDEKGGENLGKALSALEKFADGYAAKTGGKEPPYLDYVTDYVEFFYGDGRRKKFVLDDIPEADKRVLKDILNGFLKTYRLRTDIDEEVPQGIYRYVQVVTEKSPKEYSYFFRGEIKVGDGVKVPFGEENEETAGRVVSVEYYYADGVPYPAEYIKYIKAVSPAE